MSTPPVHTSAVHRPPNRGNFSVEVATELERVEGVIWAHDADRERTISFEAESEGRERKGATRKEQELVDLRVAAVWKTASHVHFNRDFQFNSQSTSMQFTPKRTIGGRAWLSIQLPSVEQEKALALWANTSPGLLLHWWHANKQQYGRGSIGKAALQTLPILDVTSLTPAQLQAAAGVFEAFKDRPLLPLHEIDKDPVRREVDEQFLRKVLGFPASMAAPGGPLDLLRAKLAQEPSIRGHKQA